MRKLLVALMIIVSLSMIIVTVFPVVHVANAQAFTRIGSLALNQGEDYPSSAVIDSASGFAYFGTDTSPGVVVKVRLSDFTRVGALTLNTGEGGLGSAVIDSANGFAYFGTDASPGVVVKVSLSDFTRVGALTLNSGEFNLRSAVIDSANGFAYFGADTTPGVIVKVKLSDLTRVGALTLNLGEEYPGSAVIDSANGFAYFTVNGYPGVIVKVRLSDFTRVGALTLNSGEESLISAVIDSANGFAYFGADHDIVVKVRLSDFTRVGSVTVFDQTAVFSQAAVIDTTNGFAYFGTFASPAAVVKIRLSDLTFAEALTLNTGENSLYSAVIDSANGFAYFGTRASPGIIVKIDIAAPPPPSFDFSLSNSGSISVQQGSSGSNTVTATLTSGTAQAVALSCVASSLPVGASCSFNPSSVTPSSAGATSELTVFTTSSTPTGSFQVQVTGSPLGATTIPTTFTLTVTPSSSSHGTFTNVVCGPSPVVINHVASCFAVVTDTASGASTPTGTVTFTPGGTCTLGPAPGTTASASCLVGITPTAPGSLSVSAGYDGDTTHAASSSQFLVTVISGVVFTVSSNPTVNSPVAFTATVTGAAAPYSFSWDFGDGSAAGTTNPVIHTYTTTGAETVTLTVTDSASATAMSSQTISVAGPPLSASFAVSANPTVGSPITFTATATGGTAPYTFRWDFGDGSAATAGNPVTHTYTSSGAKTVTLTVTDVSSGSTVLSDTWEFKAGVWTQLSPSSSPSPRFVASMAYDAADGYILLFGGSNNIGGSSVLGDTWEFHAGTWTQLSPPSRPSPRTAASMVYDSADGYILLYGGSDGNLFPLGDTWKFQAGIWTQLSPSSSPSSRLGASMVYDAADGYVLLFGGNFQGDTWEFHAGSWTQLSPTSSPSPRFVASMTYDAADGYVLLFGGSDIANPSLSLGDTWEFKAGVWTQLSPSSSPSPRFLAPMVYDEADGYVLLLGGSDTSNPSASLSDTWTFKAGSWTQLSSTSSPLPRSADSTVYSAADASVLLFGGVGPSTPIQSTTIIDVSGQLLSPAQASQNLIDTVKSLQLSGSAQTSLLGPLHNIVKILTDKGSTNDITACYKLTLFINTVNNDQRRGILTMEQAAQLRQLATSIMTQLGC